MMAQQATKENQEREIALLDGFDYVAVPANSAAMPLGAGGGASGDTLSHLLITPLNTSPGPVSIKDGDGAAITVFAGGANSLGQLVPFPVSLGGKSASGPWKITTGANVQAVAFGRFA
ncbi:hypothetical protein SZ64_07890 [Erythrobacter sp. SG61-1L]|uniref:hypothetical protein n=1 Tax=Erythrobacter sp. SG61-1L TaxID=1603897 RepID=UPI0006C8F208|nr:hypothetical protein [Erythrobacter sp. SG61-1L]KPL68047.1 hypothetical protein SZ64_07890 [Erythrobacter sp. SG61-1L]